MCELAGGTRLPVNLARLSASNLGAVIILTVSDQSAGPFHVDVRPPAKSGQKGPKSLRLLAVRQMGQPALELLLRWGKGVLEKLLPPLSPTLAIDVRVRRQ